MVWDPPKDQISVVSRKLACVAGGILVFAAKHCNVQGRTASAVARITQEQYTGGKSARDQLDSSPFFSRHRHQEKKETQPKRLLHAQILRADQATTKKKLPNNRAFLMFTYFDPEVHIFLNFDFYIWCPQLAPCHLGARCSVDPSPKCRPKIQIG